MDLHRDHHFRTTDPLHDHDRGGTDRSPWDLATSGTFLALLGLLLWASSLPAETRAEVAPIVLDGEFDDWTALTADVEDGTGDAGSSGIDFGRVWVANDHRFLFVRFETGTEVQGDEQQSMRLYLDTDMDAGTGVSYGGIGADLVWDFGQRSGEFRGSPVGHADLGMLLGPTVSSTQFEIALRLDAVPAGGQSLFPGSQVRLILRDLAGGGDRVPDDTALVSDILSAPVDDPAIPLGRDQESHVRVASYNVLSNSLFDGGATESAYTRILGAIDADVWVLNEIWDFDAAETADRMEELLPAGPGASWSAVKRDQGNVIVSRYPVVGEWDVLPGARLTAVELDLAPVHDRHLLVVAAHFSCCTADQNRQEQADALVAFLRDAQTPGGRIDLPVDTPIVAAGDFNLVGWRQQLETILTGDIQDEGAFGPDHAPDWDGSDLDYAVTTHTDQRVGYTWRRDSSSFLPGVLDFVFHTGSVVGTGNHFILDTRTMRTSTLLATGLQAGDTEQASDHSPRVVDLVLEVGTAAPPSRIASARVVSVRPNPFNPRTEIVFRTKERSEVLLEVVDLKGRLVRTLRSGAVELGTHRVIWDGRDAAGGPVASGSYLLRLRAGATVDARKLLLIR